MEGLGARVWAERFSLLSPWFPSIMGEVKKDCKTEHLRLDPVFVQQHFGGIAIHKITLEDMRAVYLQQIFAGNERVAEFIANRWLFRNMEMYRFFEAELAKISPEFEKISELSGEQAEALVSAACAKFDCGKVLCFVALNEVALPKEHLEKLQRHALQLLAQKQEQETEESEADRLRQELNRLKERHERKVAEMNKKHQFELQRLQKEVAQLRHERAKK